MPKVSSPETLAMVGRRLAALKADLTTRVWAMIETPAAILNIRDIADAADDAITRLACFVMGTNDLAKETRARFLPGRAPMTPWLMQAVAAARANDLDILDGVFNDLGNDEAFRSECEQGRDCGFDGKTLIHPRQVPIANEVFSPTAEEVEWAEKVVAAFARPENANKGVISVEGQMVERLHEQMAQRVIETAVAILPPE